MANGVIAQYRDTHHRIAQMFAMGMTPGMIRQQTGISQRRLNLYWNDPTFQELIKKYSASAEEKLALANDVITEYSTSTMILMAAALNDRAQEVVAGEGDPMPTPQMLKIFESLADRFGYGKHQTIKHEHDFATALDRAIERSGKAHEVKMIDAKAEPVILPTVAPALPGPDGLNSQPCPSGPTKTEPKVPSFSGTFRRIRVA